MHRLAGTAVFMLILGTSTVAFADRKPPRPDPAEEAEGEVEEKAEEVEEVEEKVEEVEEKAEEKAEKIEEKAEAKAEKVEEKAEEKKSGSCSVSDQDDAMFAVAALVLLMSGLGLRRVREVRGE